MPPPDTRDPSPFSDSDQEWYDRLGPSTRPPAQTAAQREGDTLMGAMRAADEQLVQRPDMRAALSDEAAEQRWQRLQSRLDAEGLLTTQPHAQRGQPRAAAPRPGWWSRMRSALDGILLGPPWRAVAALTLLVALGTVIVPVWMSGRVYDPPGELKGADDVRQVTVARPRRAAEAFAAELTRAGLKPGIFQRDPTFIVDIDVERDQLLAATPAFAGIGLQVRMGFTRIEFDPPR